MGKNSIIFLFSKASKYLSRNDNYFERDENIHHLYICIPGVLHVVIHQLSTTPLKSLPRVLS